MKKTFIESLKIIAVALVIGWGVSGVSAFSPGPFPDWQVPAVINTGAENQIKQGGLLSEKFLVSDLGFFTKTLLPGKDSWLNIGSRLNVAPGAINNGGSTIPLTIDLSGRAKVTKNGTEGQNAINFISGQTSCSTATAFINDRASAFEFTSGGTDTGHADLIARQLQLSGGSPQDGSVLASDAYGNAVWAKLVVQGGVLKVINNQTGFPVVADADCNPPAATYHWETGDYGQCTNFSTPPTFSATWEPVSNNSAVASAAVYGANVSSLGKYCPAPATFTYVTGIHSRTVTCVDANGLPADSPARCDATTKPDIIENCTETKNVEYRVTSATQSLNSGRIYSQGTILNNNCVYRKPTDTTPWLPPSDAFIDFVATDCKVLPISNRTSNISGYYTAGRDLTYNYLLSPLPVGTVPESHCGYITTPDADYMAPPSGFHPGAVDNGTLHRYIFEYRLKP